MVGEYRVVSKLSEGGMGEVYSGVHPLIEKKVAIKVIRRALGFDKVALERFVQEARAVNQIGHPNIVDIFAFGSLRDGRSYFIMEWLAGETLGDRLARGRMPLLDALRVLDQIADALEAAHEKGVVHRDLKPDNVFLVPTRGGRERVKLVDFGLAKLAITDDRARGATEPGFIMGTPEYMSPEQARGRDVGPGTDIYALGCVAYEMLTLELPFEEDNAAELISAHLYSSPASPCLLWPEIPAQLERMILLMLAKDAVHRPTLPALREVLRGLGVESFAAMSTNPGIAVGSVPVPLVAPVSTTPTPVVGPEPVPARRSRAGLALLVALVVGVAGAVALGVMMGGGSNTPSQLPVVAMPAPEPVKPPPAPEPPPLPPPAPIIKVEEPPPKQPPPPPAPAPATLVIRANVPARISVDGELLATSAEVVEVPISVLGDHQVTVVAPGRAPVEKTVRVAAGTRVEVPVLLNRPRAAPVRKSDKDYMLDPFK